MITHGSSVERDLDLGGDEAEDGAQLILHYIWPSAVWAIMDFVVLSPRGRQGPPGTVPMFLA